MDDTQDLIDFEALDVRERRLKAEDVKKLLHSLNMQPGNIGTPSDHHPYQYINSPAVKGLPLFPVPLSQPMSISSSPSTNATPAQSIGPPVSEPGSSGNNSYHSCDSASNLGWEAFKDLSTIPPRVSTYDNFNHSEVSFGQHDDSVSVETSRASPEALNIHNPLSRSHLNQRRIPSENLIELDGSVDVVREFDPLAEETPKADTMRPRRKVQTGEGPSGSPLTIVNQLSNSMPKSSTASVQSGKKLISTKSFGFANIKLVRKDSGILIQLKQLEAKVLGKIYPNGVKTDETHWSHGVIISPRSKLTNPPWLVSSVKLIVHTSKDEAPLKFTCDVSTSVESLIYQIVYSSCSNNGEEPACSYALKIWGKDEYLVNDSRLSEYVHVYSSIKLNKDIELSLVSTDLLLCQHMQNEDGRDSDMEKKSLEEICDAVLPHPIHETNVNNCLNFLTLESQKIMTAANNGDPVETNKFCQLVKALCATFCNVVPFDLDESLDRLKAEANTLSEERRTLMKLQNSVSSIPKPSSEYISQLNKAMQSVCGSVHRLITIFCQSPVSEFRVEPVEERNEDKKELIRLEYELLFCAESLHNIPPNWITEYEKFFISCSMYYGTEPMAQNEEIICGPATINHSGFYPVIYFKQFVQFSNSPLCILPREARLCLLLYGSRLETSNSAATDPAKDKDTNDAHFTKTQLASASVCIFDNDGHIRQQPLLVSFSHSITLHPWGCDSNSLGPDRTTAQLIISFTKYGFDVVFPEVEASERDSRGSNNPTLDETTKSDLHEIIFKRKPDDCFFDDEKEMLWEKRYGLVDIPDALPPVLLSANSWDWPSLINIYHLISQFTPMCPIKALELLLPKFPDKEVRRKAVEWVSVASVDELIIYLPQLIETLRYELREDSDMAVFLLTLASTDWKFAHKLYWQLEERCELQIPIGYRCRLMREVLVRILGNRFTQIFQREKWLLSQLDVAAVAVKASSSSNKQKIVLKQIDPLDHQLSSDPVCLPIEPAFKASGFDLAACSYFDSKTRPLDLTFRNVESSYGAIYKVGDDLRQDALVIQLVSLMERIWLDAGLDLKVLTFQCLSTGKCKGLVEKVPHSRTLRQIQVEGGGLTGSFRDSLLVSWIQNHNPSELDYEIALTNFRKSSSAWCVCTYVLGLGDRHNDNILMTTKGHVFHIDFGKYLGDYEKFGRFKRDRVPFVLTSDMAYVINAGSKQKTTFQEFVDDCCSAFNCLRNNSYQLLNLLKMMVCSGIPGINMDAVRFIHANMWLDRTDTEATARFTRMIEETLKSIAPKMNFFIHNLAQWKSTASENPVQLLSFTPKTFRLGDEGKIVFVEVLSCEKRQFPEKHYLFKLSVCREQETVPTVVYRTYKELYEFYEKVYMRFPLAELSALSSGRTIGRSNIRVVAERQKLEIKEFLDSLFSLSAEVAHCDLVYTFFHPLLRDQQEAERSDFGADASSPSQSVTMSGKIKFSVSYSSTKGELEVFVQFAKDLSLVGGKPPDSYVKLYLLPDPGRTSKRKTKVEKSNCNPVFNERFVYLYPPAILRSRLLELNVWQHDFLKENSFLGGLQMPLEQIIDNPEIVTNSWFALGRVRKFPTVPASLSTPHF